MESGEVERKINNMIESLELPSGEEEIAKTGLETIQANHGDFIIAWGNFTPHFTINGQNVESAKMISGDSINFSQMERKNPKLQEVMRYTRAILNFSILVMLGHNIWSTLMITLGISPSIYDKATEESRIIEKQREQERKEQERNEQRWLNRLEKQKYNEWLRRHKK